MAYRGFGLAPLFGGSTPAFGLRREIDRLFDDAFGAQGRGGSGRSGATWSPAIDVREDANAISLDIELPGMKAEDVDVSVENGVLSVRGEKRVERKEGEEGQYHVIERSYGSFFRSFHLPQGVNEEDIRGDFKDGVLTLQIPKAALPQPRKIEIGGGSRERVQGAGTDAQSGSRSESGSSRSESGRESRQSGREVNSGGKSQKSQRDREGMAASES